MNNGQPYGQPPYGQPPIQQDYGQQQPYEAPPKQEPYGYNGAAPPPPTGPPPSYNEVFKVEKPKWNDLWAGILFLIVCAGFVAVSAISLQGYASTRNINGSGLNNQTNRFGLTTHTIYLFIFVLVTAVVFSYAYIWLARMFTKQFIWITGILNILFTVATAVFMLIKHYWSGGIVFIIFAAFYIFAFITWIPRIPFSALMLKTAINVAKGFGHVYLVSAIGGIIGALYGAWFAVTLVAVYARFEPSNDNPNCTSGAGCSKAKVVGLIVFITFASYWISEWLKNTIHTTISGVYGAWYYNSRQYPRGVTRGALRRSLTYSFGSISLGSLIVAIINLLRQLCSVAQQQAASDGNIVGYVLFCILGCLISLLDWAVQFINRYAFSHIALYGKPYIQAAKDTWRMIKDRGIDALVNECLIGPVLSMGGTFVAFSCGLLAYLYMTYYKAAYNENGAFTPVVVAFAFLIGLQICNVFTTPLSSGIDTIFVAMAWDPDVLMRDHREIWDEMVRVYPHVANAIHG